MVDELNAELVGKTNCRYRVEVAMDGYEYLFIVDTEALPKGNAILAASTNAEVIMRAIEKRFLINKMEEQLSEEPTIKENKVVSIW
jgi:hypothetical protein